MKQPQKLPRRTTATISKHLKWKVQQVQGWPRLKVNDWEPVAREFFQLEEKLSSKDPRYIKLNEFCQNAKRRLEKKDSKTALVARE